ncbi:MAG: wax ester/triacylglycerol synthase family O-acyltransferase [Haloarculaceae archaeon]
MTDRELLSGTDNAWYRMDDRTNRTAITAVVTFEEPIAFETIEEICRERVLPFERFRQRVVERPLWLRPRWEDDETFALENHLHHLALTEPQDDERFQSFVGTLLARPIDLSKPPWEVFLLEGAGNGNALVVRVHHCMADGFALLFLVLWLADDPGSIELPIGDLPAPPEHIDVAFDREAERRSPTATVMGAGGGDDDSRLPSSLRSAWTLAKAGVGLAASGLKLLTMRDEPATPLVGDLGVTKRAAWTEPIDLDRVKAIGRAHDATVNDVLLAATAGALRRHLQARSGAVDPDLRLRATAPVNVKPLEGRTEQLGNYFGLGYVSLPVGTVDVDERLAAITANTGSLRQGTEGVLVYAMLRLLGRLPAPLQDLGLGIVRDKSTAVVTNVPGPTEAFDVAGETVADVMFWVPQSNGIGLGISIFSYDGRVRVGVAADARLLDEPFELADAFEAEIDALAAARPERAPSAAEQ